MRGRMSTNGSTAATAANLLTVTRIQSGGEQAGPVIRMGIFYLYIVLSVLVLLLAFAAWGSYMIRVRRSIRRLQGFERNDRIVNAEKLEWPVWLDVNIGYEETSAREASPVSAIIKDDPPSAAFPLHRSGLIPAIHAPPTIPVRNSRAELQLTFLIAMPVVSISSSSPPLMEIGVRRSCVTLPI